MKLIFTGVSIASSFYLFILSLLQIIPLLFSLVILFLTIFISLWWVLATPTNRRFRRSPLAKRIL